MSFFRQYIAPLFIVLIFLLAMVAVSARIFLPSDLAAPAPIEEPSALNLAEHVVADAVKPNASVPLFQVSLVLPKSDSETAPNG